MFVVIFIFTSLKRKLKITKLKFVYMEREKQVSNIIALTYTALIIWNFVYQN